VEPGKGLLGRLRGKIPAIAQRWLEEALATYAANAAAVFRRVKDPFVNPVGQALRTGTCAALEALVAGRPPQEICSFLDGVIKMRAVQELKPSEALSFIFALKETLRAEWDQRDSGPILSAEWSELESLIDQVALGAFDIYMKYRYQVYELRINEVKRNVARLAERIQRHSSLPRLDEELLQLGTSLTKGV
jgi:hypothetical protein